MARRGFTGIVSAIGLGALVAMALPATGRAQSAEPAAVMEVNRFAVELREDIGNAKRLRPSDAQIDAIAATAQDAELLRAYVEQVYAQMPPSGSAAKPGQTEIVVIGPALDSLPGGYSAQIGHFRDGVAIYGFKYVVPGESSGMSYDGLIHAGDEWAFIPKAWRAFAGGQ